MNIQKAVVALLGIEYSSIPSTIFLTNISPIFNSLKSFIIDYYSKSGFYECCVGSIGNDKIIMIKVLPGNNIIDVLKIVTPLCSNLFFFGLAGTIDKRFSVGDIIKPNSYGNITNNHKEFKEIRIAQSDGLIQETEFYKNLQKKGVSLVDMECETVYYYCNKNAVNLSYIVQVSDAPLHTPFYECNVLPIDAKEMLRKAGFYV